MLFDAVGTRLNNTDKTKMLNVVRTILLGIVVLSCLVVTILFGLDGCTMLFDAVGTRLNNTDKTKMLNVVRTILLGIVVLSCLVVTILFGLDG